MPAVFTIIRSPVFDELIEQFAKLLTVFDDSVENLQRFFVSFASTAPAMSVTRFHGGAEALMDGVHG